MESTENHNDRRGKKTKTIFISAAEPSADAHCANLINALSAMPYNYSFVGVGGPKMAAAGCRLIASPADRAVMLAGAIASAGRFFKILSDIKRFYKNTYVDLTIVCDSPAFNFHVAKIAKKHNCKTLFYVAPQLWAWAPWRIGKLKRRCDRLACILPFEPKYFADRGLDSDFVGNPLMDGLDKSILENAHDYENFDPSTANVALMPGSRQAEIKSLWPAMQQVGVDLKNSLGDLNFTAVAVDQAKLKYLQDNQLDNFRCDYEIGTVAETAARSDLTLVASGSATLQVAAAGCPMIVMYQSSPLLWHTVGKYLVRMQHLSLVNILAGKELVPEFMPYFRSTQPIARVAAELLGNPAAIAKVSAQLRELTSPLFKNASENVAKIVTDMLENKALQEL